MASDRDILAFARRSDDDDALVPGVQFDAGMGRPPGLRARWRDQRRDDMPPWLECDLWDVRALISQGYLSERGPSIRITEAGTRQLASLAMPAPSGPSIPSAPPPAPVGTSGAEAQGTTSTAGDALGPLRRLWRAIRGE
jgi:hypothetical protein